MNASRSSRSGCVQGGRGAAGDGGGGGGAMKVPPCMHAQQFQQLVAINAAGPANKNNTINSQRSAYLTVLGII